MATKWVYDFSEGSREMRDLLGGKGANVAEMTRILGRRARARRASRSRPRRASPTCATSAFPDGLDEQVDEALAALEERAGKQLGDADDPLLVSVRSGARESMPGMLDTVLNLGLNDDSVAGLARKTGNERFAWDSYRRFVQMFGNVVRGIEGERFEDEIKRVKADRGVKRRHRARRRRAARAHAAPSRSSTSSRPTRASSSSRRSAPSSTPGTASAPSTYRRINRIPDDWGTAVNVQQMVFGNKGDVERLGRRLQPRRGHRRAEPRGDFLINAQGEDVVSGVRNTRDISELDRRACPRSTSSSWRSCASSSATTATCRTPSSRSRRAGSTCCRRATPSARRRRRCASRSTRWPRGCSTRRRRWPRSTPRRSTRCCTRPSTRRPSTRCSRRAWPPRRARRRARSSSRPPTRWPPPPTGATSSSCARSPRPTTSPASTRPRASSPPRAARPRTRRSSRAGWACRRSPGASDAGDRRVGRRGARGRDDAARGRPDRDRRHHRRHHDRRRRRWSSPRSATRSTPSWGGPTSCAACACARTPTRPRTPARRASSAPRASACAAPSTCSSARTATRRWSR